MHSALLHLRPRHRSRIWAAPNCEKLTACPRPMTSSFPKNPGHLRESRKTCESVGFNEDEHPAALLAKLVDGAGGSASCAPRTPISIAISVNTH